MTKRKGQMIGEGVAGPIAFIEDAPAPLIPVTAANVLLRDATRPPERPRDSKRMDERRPSGQSCAVGDGLLLEDHDRSRVKLHLSKIISSGRKQSYFCR